MKFPSIKTLSDGAVAVLNRFPLSIGFTVVGTTAAILNTGIFNRDAELSNWYWRVVMMADLGLLLTLSAALYCESKSLTGTKANLFKSIAVVVAIILLFVLNPIKRDDDTIRFLLLSLGFHLLVAFAGFIGKENINGFWQFNKTLFLRFLSGVLYSGVLYLGLAAAIAALNFLFGFKFEWRTFSILWIVIAGLFNTFFVLAGVPDDHETLDQDNTYPKSLKIFTQYVLIPLITVYLLILLAYEVKILVDWSLPKGRVSSLVLAYAVFGILSLLLVYPIRNQIENKWIKSFSKSFYFFMLPLLALLFLAVSTRVFKYGITEERYFLIVLAFWLLGVSLYFLISKRQNIKVIPISLCIVVLLSIYGPQSAFSLSYSSQKSIIAKIFKRNHAFKDGLLLSVDERKFSHEDAAQAISAFQYVISGNGLTALQTYLKQDLRKVADSLNRGDATENRYFKTDAQLQWVKKQVSLEHFNDRGDYMGKNYENDDFQSNHQITVENQEVIPVAGFDYYIDANFYNNDNVYKLPNKDSLSVIEPTKGKYQVKLDNATIVFDVQRRLDSLSKTPTWKSYENDKKYLNQSIVPADLMIIDKSTVHYNIRLLIKTISTSDHNDVSNYIIRSVEGKILLKKR